MEFVHRCHFCDWQREAASPTILEPSCERCGSLLDSLRKDDLTADRPIEPLSLLTVRISSLVAGALRLTAGATVVFTAAATGLEAGGAWLALSAVGAAGLAAAPVLLPR
jgi:hypothetical protein